MTDGVYVRVRVGGEHYALPVSTVLEVAPFGDVMPMPGAPAHVIGVRNIRGDVVPVVDLRAVARLGATRDAAVVAVVEEAGRRAALAVDEVVAVGPVPDIREERSSPLLRGAAMADGDLVGLLDVDAVLAAAARLQEG